jgi:hypothetical protein
MRRVSLGIVVYLIWEERNKRIFDNTWHTVDVIFHKFQVIFYMILHFHEQNHFSLNVGWIVSVLCDVWSLKSSHPVVALDGPELCAWSLL